MVSKCKLGSVGNFLKHGDMIRYSGMVWEAMVGVGFSCQRVTQFQSLGSGVSLNRWRDCFHGSSRGRVRHDTV